VTESTAQRAPLRFSLTVSRGLRESGAIALAVLALVICVALLSFDPSDPGFSTTGHGAQIHNRVGPIGAWIANALYFLFGRPAYLVPVLFGVAAGRLMRANTDKTHSSRLNLAIRIAGFVIVLVASCSLADLHWDPGVLPQSAGGIVGSAAGDSLAAGLKLLGATLLLLAAWMAGVAVAFGVSWLTIMDRMGAWTWAGVNWARERWFANREVKAGRSAKLERQEAKQAERQRTPVRITPRIIEPPAPAAPKSARREGAAGAALRPASGHGVAAAGHAG